MICFAAISMHCNTTDVKDIGKINHFPTPFLYPRSSVPTVMLADVDGDEYRFDFAVQLFGHQVSIETYEFDALCAILESAEL